MDTDCDDIEDDCIMEPFCEIICYIFEECEIYVEEPSECEEYWVEECSALADMEWLMCILVNSSDCDDIIDNCIE